ncbi:hypothetical protein MR626_03575 [bacterium]|nr:hypothetical protein [bacterium]MDY4582634.1 hypothetical protein [Candidatus Faecousia sp.]
MRKEIGILLMAVLLAVPLWGCQRSRDTVPEKTVPKATLPKQTAPGKEDPGDQTETIPALDAVSDRGQLMAGAESRQEAEELARLYGITLVDYQHQVALFFTEEDPGEVIQRGKDNGWPELSLNRISHIS